MQQQYSEFSCLQHEGFFIFVLLYFYRVSEECLDVNVFRGERSSTHGKPRKESLTKNILRSLFLWFVSM